jgi:hypothetical protein
MTSSFLNEDCSAIGTSYCDPACETSDCDPNLAISAIRDLEFRIEISPLPLNQSEEEAARWPAAPRGGMQFAL